VKPAKLVAVGIANIGKVELAVGQLPVTGRILDRGATGRDGAVVPRFDLLGAVEVNPIVPPFAQRASPPSIGFETMNTAPLLR
jgi:hypothetical protein